MNESKLLAKLSQSEDGWVERKESYSSDKVLHALVGFANSLPEGADDAVLFLGASNSGNHPGLPDADDVQKRISGLVIGRAYPEIKVTMKVLRVTSSGRTVEILAVAVPPSSNKPHFSGAAWVRRGSETVRATPELYEGLIASRVDTVRLLERYKEKQVVLSLISQPTGLRIDYYNARVRSLTATTVEVDTNEGGYYPLGTSSIVLSHDNPNLPRIAAPCPWTEQEHVSKMIRRWAQANPDSDGVTIGRYHDLAEQILSNLRVTLDAVRWEAKRSPSKAAKVLLSTAEMIAREQRI
jgi:hypothetical protein